jgi:hypothetical protein
MGQKRTVQVWKLVVKGTVEEKMMQVLKKRAGPSSASAASEAPPLRGKAARGRGSAAPVAGSVTRDVVASVKDEELDLLFS